MKSLRKLITQSALAVLAVLVVLAVQSAQATPYYWDTNGITNGSGTTPNGTWDGTNTLWNSFVGGGNGTFIAAPTVADDVFFSAGTDAVNPYTVTLTGTQSVLRVLSQSPAAAGNVTLSGGTLGVVANSTSNFQTTNGTSNLVVNSAVLLTNGNATANNGIYFKPGTGTTITINGTISATTNNTIQLHGTEVSGGTTIINSDLGADANFRAGLAKGTLTMGGNGTLTLNGNQTLAGNGTGTTTVSIASVGSTLNFGSTVNLANAVSIGGKLNVGTGANVGIETVNMNSAVTILGVNSSWGNGGIVNVGGSLTNPGLILGSSTVDTTRGGSLNILHGGAVTLSNTMTLKDGFVVNVGGTLTGTNLSLGSATTGGGSIVLGDANGVGTATFSGTWANTAGPTATTITGGNSSISTLALSTTLAATQAITGVLGGAGTYQNNISLLKSNNGNYTLSGNNTYVGATSFTNSGVGRLIAGVASGPGYGAFGNNSSITWNGGSSGGVLELAGFNTQVGSLASTSTGASVVLGTATLTTGGDNTSTSFNGTISGTGGLTKIGAGNQTLAHNSTYTGATTINGGTLSVAVLANGGTASGIGSSTNAASNLVLGGGTLQYTGGNQSTDRNFTLTAATTSTIDVASAAANLTVNGTSTATSGGLTKAGAGTLTLGGVNTYTGTTTISAGTLVLADNAELRMLVGSNGVNNQVNGSGTITLNGDFRFDLTGAGITGGNSWNIITVGSLAETFGGTFLARSTLGDFTNSGGIWSISENSVTYEFSQATGLLTVVPEPSTWLLLAATGTFFMVMRRRRHS